MAIPYPVFTLPRIVQVGVSVDNAEKYAENHLIFGVFVTATTDNLQEIIGKEFLDKSVSSIIIFV